MLIEYINFLVFLRRKKQQGKIDAHIKSEEPIYELVPSCLWKRPFVTKCYWPRRVAISLGGCFEEKEGGGGGGDQGRWMERKGHSDGNYGRKI